LVSGEIHWTTDGDLSEIPDGAVLAVPESFDGEFTGDVERLGGIVDRHGGMTSYAAIVARELAVPMISNASLAEDVADGTVVTLDAERGVVYEGAIEDRRSADRKPPE
jgi:pyruvate kinase